MKFFLLLILLIFKLSLGQGIQLEPQVEKKMNIRTIKVSRTTITEDKIYPANVVDDPSLSFEVSVPVDGIIEKVFVKQGDVIKASTPLLKVYSPKIAQLQSDIQMALVKLKATKDTLEREEMLYKEEVIPYSRFYSAKIDYEKAKGEFEALKKILNSFGEVIGNSIVIRSKVDGFVAESKAINGMPVNLGDSVMRIHSHKRLWVEAMVPFEDTKYIKRGQKALVINTEGREAWGKVTLINHELDPKTSRNMVRIEVINPHETIKPNMFVNVKIALSKKEGIFLPYEAVISKDNKNFVFVREGKSITSREVKVGSKLSNYLEITSGLKEGEEVIVGGILFLKSHFFNTIGE